MYNIETVESLHAYASRLQHDSARIATTGPVRRPTVRALFRRIRRSA